MSKGFCSSADPTGFLGRRIYSGRNLLHFQLKVGVVVWFFFFFFPPFCVQLHSIDWCHCFSMYMYLQPQYCVSYSLNINNFCNFKTGGGARLSAHFVFPSPKILAKKKKKKVCMTFIVFRDRGSVSPSKIGDGDCNCIGATWYVLCLAVLVSILLVVLDTVSLFY